MLDYWLLTRLILFVIGNYCIALFVRLVVNSTRKEDRFVLVSSGSLQRSGVSEVNAVERVDLPFFTKVATHLFVAVSLQGTLKVSNLILDWLDVVKVLVFCLLCWSFEVYFIIFLKSTDDFSRAHCVSSEFLAMGIVFRPYGVEFELGTCKIVNNSYISVPLHHRVSFWELLWYQPSCVAWLVYKFRLFFSTLFAVLIIFFSFSFVLDLLFYS